MGLIHNELIQKPSAWAAADFVDNESWIHVLNDTAKAEIDQALAVANQCGLSTDKLSVENFPLPTLSTDLKQHANELENGRGFLLLRGLPVERYSDEDITVIYYYAHLGKNEPALSPIFSFHEGKLSCRYLRQYIELAHDMVGHPLSRVEIEAFDLFDSIMHGEKLRIDMMLEPGDLQFANNYMVMHSRTEFEDFTEQDQRRKMLRLWLKMPNARNLAADFPGRNGFPAPLEGSA